MKRFERNENALEQRGVADGHCVHHLIEKRAQENPDATAIAAPGRGPLTYARLLTQIYKVVQALRSAGVGRNDRVAIVLPNGPETAVVFWAVAAAATSAPLNPDLRETEFEFYLSDLDAKALIVEAGSNSPAIPVARSRGIPIIKLSPLLHEGAGAFRLTADESLTPSEDGDPQPNDVALVVHTSGTTAKPKLVPLTHENLCSASLNCARAFELTDQDRYINVLPLFLTHGPMRILWTLISGGSVVCAPGFDGENFYKWLEEFRPTWYSAVPTIHQVILAQSSQNRAVIERCPLRFITSSSSLLPQTVSEGLEKAMNAPVIDYYGATEALGVACGPLPPRTRKPGSVGVSIGPQIAVIDESGRVLPQGETGEVVVRGSSVASGYINNPEINQQAFINGWFRMGDLGYLDKEGYLFVTGRIKDIINRGGQKISPREIDEVLMSHAAIFQAVAFPVPHSTLGEDVAAAVVLHQNREATETELRRFTAERLADFKVPRRILRVDEIPKSPSGKVKRAGLADRLGLTLAEQAARRSEAGFVAPRSPLENGVVQIWREILGVDEIGVHDNFFDLGGNSLLASQATIRFKSAFGVEISVREFFEAATVATMATAIADRRAEQSGEDDISSILAELETLSDEQTRLLLAKKKDAHMLAKGDSGE